MRLTSKEDDREALRRLVEHATVREVDKFHLALQAIKEKQYERQHTKTNG